MSRCRAALTAFLFCTGLGVAPWPARADAPLVRIRLPLYVTVPSLRAFNSNSHDFAPYEPNQFRLIAGGRVYYPVVRPGLGALDLSTSGSVPPRGSLLVTVTFDVPAGTRSADLEFIPHWFDDNGRSVAFCCLYQ